MQKIPKLRYNTLMLMAAFLQWWYGPGWRDAGQKLRGHIRNTYLMYSVPQLLRTMFEPWRRITSNSGPSLDAKMRDLADNLVSRFIGFMVRLFTIIAAGTVILFWIIFGGLFVLLWPFLPILGPALIVGGLLV